MKKETVIPALVFSLLILVFASFHIYFGLSSIRQFSPTYDEPVHLTAGAVYWKTGDYRYNGYHHPPLAEMWAAIPMIFMKPHVPRFHPAWIKQRWTPTEQYRFADAFLYRNRISHETLMEAGRKMQLVLSLLVGVALGVAAWILGGGICSLIAVGLWAFSPTMIAHGTLVSTDLAFALFFFLFFFSLIRWEKWGWNVLSGIFLGLCVASKYLSVSVGPVLVVFLGGAYLYKYFIRKDRRFLREIPIGRTALRVGVIALTSFLVLLIVYRFADIDVFFGGLKKIFSRSQAGRSSFFMGEHRTTGWIHYFPVVFLIKTPIPILIGLLVSGVLLVRKKISFPALLVVAPLVFFLIACTSKVQIGHRHILAIYPFLFLGIAYGLSRLSGWLKSIPVLMLAWLFISAWMMRPYFLSYFNEAVGGPARGYQYLTDSNVDWGQGLKELRSNLSDEDLSKGIFLSYFGVADPHAYGIPYLSVGSDTITGHQDDRNKPQIRPTKLAISITNYHSTYFRNKEVFEWLKSYQPDAVIAHSLFLYDFSRYPDALERLNAMVY